MLVEGDRPWRLRLESPTGVEAIVAGSNIFRDFFESRAVCCNGVRVDVRPSGLSGCLLDAPLDEQKELAEFCQSSLVHLLPYGFFGESRNDGSVKLTHYEDLSPYRYVRESIPAGVSAVNVGWLEPDKGYNQGNVSAGFIDSLALIVRGNLQMKMRGWHSCQLPHVGYAEPYPTTVYVAGKKVSLGGAEVRVVSKSGEWMIAPDLVFHYVAAHSYEPPADFIDAVMAQRIAPVRW
ncbi:hypothetical protein [Streptomyces sp. NL15-2K]|uniref:DUF7919 family protein n=1 Tax=Streptomyces sp. NL15-2K TaxID=376149 RepID=UPI00209C6683|nr:MULTISPECIES: hypothetical protein [Actinomycetes]WKX12149.1 hypothetical protein Q4V64_33385 [Kutzneria buriramensis]